MGAGSYERQPSPYHHPLKAGTVTVAGKPSVEVPLGTLANALRQAGLKK
jgi:predicted RNA binding protein YcfA (HicA-like mRNA interferase family)